MRIGSDSPDSTPTAGTSAPAGKASPEGARATPARSGALAPLGARRSSSTSAPLQAGGDPKGKFNERGSTIKLHAERRIQHYVRETFGELLDRRLLAGTMRPCGTCADELGLDDGERRGPFWLSRAGQAFADTPRIIERNIASGVGTFVTKTREGRVTTDHDTDSDSDLDDGEARTARSRG